MNKKIAHISFHRKHIDHISIAEEMGLEGTCDIKVIVDIDHNISGALIESLSGFYKRQEIFTLDYFPDDDFIERIKVRTPLIISRHEVTCIVSRIISTYDFIVAEFAYMLLPDNKYRRAIAGVNYIMKSEASS